MGTLDILRQRIYGRTFSEQKKNIEAEAWETPRGKGASAAGGKDGIAREQFAAKRLQELGADRIQVVETHNGGRLSFNPLGRDEQYDRLVPGVKYDNMRQTAMRRVLTRRDALRYLVLGAGAAGGVMVAANSKGIGKWLASLIPGARAAPGAGISGPTLSSSGDIDAKRIGGVRYVTEFDSALHAGTSVDPFTDAAMTSALADLPSTGGRISQPSVYLQETRPGGGGPFWVVSKANTEIDLQRGAVINVKAGLSHQYLFLCQANGFTFRGGTLDGSGATMNFAFYAVSIGSSDLVFDRILLKGFGVGGGDSAIQVLANSVTISRVMINRCVATSGRRLTSLLSSGTGILTDYWIVECDADGLADAGFAVSGVSSGQILRGHFCQAAARGCGNHGLSIASYATGADVVGGSYKANGGSGIAIGTATSDVTISGPICDGNTQHGITIDTGTGGGAHWDTDFDIVAAILINNVLTGLYINKADFGSVGGISTRGNGNYGILEDGNAVSIVGGRSFGNTFADVQIGADVTDFVTVYGRRVGSSTTPRVAAVAAALPYLIARGCPGFNPVGVIASPFDNTANQVGPQLAAPGATITSAKVYTCVICPLDIYLNGGTVSAVAINGTAVVYNSSGILYHLEPGDTVTITHTGAPTFVVIGQ